MKLKSLILIFTTSLLGADPYLDAINNRATETQKIINDGYAILEYKALKASRFFGQATAGSIAVSSIDFGTTCKGTTEFGIGTGISSSYISKVYAGAIAAKHGVTNDTAIIIKGWKSDGSSYSIGIGATHKIRW